MDPNVYNKSFFNQQKEGSRRSASRVVPLIMQIAQPASVVDVGCGLGTWLAEFRELGVQKILGMDGDYVDRSELQIPPSDFRPHDLTRPIDIGLKFDLAISLEVAEHLPPECAAAFVKSLVGLAPVVVFSAAIPHQGGTNHLNESWQVHWCKLFIENGYTAYDPIRPLIWRDREVEISYRQNLLVYAREGALSRDRIAAAHLSRPSTESLVHPELFYYIAEQNSPENIGVRRAARQLAFSLRRAVVRRILGRRRPPAPTPGEY